MTRPTCDIREAYGLRLLLIPAEGPALLRAEEADEFLSEAWGRDADLILIPASRLGDGFFRLETGFAGAMLQKFVNYRMRVAVLGDFAPWTAQSRALRDFIHECNKGEEVWLLASQAELEARLASGAASA